MVTAVSYPGVHVEEVPAGVRSISGVSTSTVAFVGYTQRGPTHTPIQIFSFSEFERHFGGLASESHLAYAVSQFFLNGGTTAWVVRVASDDAVASITLRNGIGGGSGPVLVVSARSGGQWGNSLCVRIDYETSNPGSLFNMTIIEMEDHSGCLVPGRSEVHRNLSMDSAAPNYAVSIVNSASAMVDLRRDPGIVFARSAIAESGPLSAADLARLGNGARRLAVALNGSALREFDIFSEGEGLAGGNLAAQATDLAARIQAAVIALDPGNPAFANFTCAAIVSGAAAVLYATSGTLATDREHSAVGFSDATIRNAAAALRLGPANGGREVSGAASMRPQPSGTVWPRFGTDFDFTSFSSPSSLTIALMDPAGTAVDTRTVTLWTAAADRPGSLPRLRAQIEMALNSATERPEFARATASIADGRIVMVPGGEDPSLRFIIKAGPQAGSNDISNGAEVNVAAHRLGIGPTIGAQCDAVPGSDGREPTAVQLAGSRSEKTGLFALEDVDIFNILLLPNQSDAALLAQAIAYAEERRSFVIVDLPDKVATLEAASNWLGSGDALSLRHPNAAAFFPRVHMADPLRNNQLRSFANSGAVAGIFARTDASAGVWKAPAGTDATVRGSLGLDCLLTDQENGVLNPRGLNCLRTFPAYGTVVWGSRTLDGSDEAASEWKYIPVRRLALFIEESLSRGTQWVVFEPNDVPLWAQIRLNVGAFMHTLFRQGAFQGKTPKEAYLVKCDETTTTRDDINLGIVNIFVGFAPLKPAEFVIIKLQRLAGQAGAGT